MIRAFLALLTGLAAIQAAEPVPRNFLLLCIDDLKPLLGCYGNSQVKTPHIDRLAARGIVFERAYCNLAQCASSRISLLTGLRPSTLGIYNLNTPFRRVAPDTVTFAQVLKSAGWRTESVGKVMHDKFDHEDPVSWSVPHWYPLGGLAAHLYALPENIAQRQRAGNAADRRSAGADGAVRRGPATECADVPDDTYSDGLIAGEAIRRLRAAHADPGTPFFLAVGFVKPHLPFCAPKKYWDLYDPAKLAPPGVREPPRQAPDYALPGTELKGYVGFDATPAAGSAQERELIHAYHAAVSYMDAQVGRVLDELDRLQLSERTTIVLWGDHGWHLGNHGFWGKATNYEEAVRIPLIVVAPSLTHPRTRSFALVETVDLYPTFVELAGLPAPDVPQRLEGRSFVSVLREPYRPTKDAIFHSFLRTKPGTGDVVGNAVRTGRHRLVEWRRPGESGARAGEADYELYDYVNDPGETRNVAGEHPSLVRELVARLRTQPNPRAPAKRPGGSE